MADLHTRLKIWVNDAERWAVDALYSVVPEESVREGWHRAFCLAHPDCDWTTSGAENPCDDAGYEHVAEAHRTGPQAVEALQALAALRAVVKRHAPVDHGAFGSLCSACSQTEGRDVLRFVSAPCPEIQAIARELGVDAGGQRD